MLHAMRHSHALEHFLHALLALRRSHAAIGERQFHVLENRQVTYQIEGLKYEPDFAVANARAIGKRKVRHWLCIDPVVSIRRRVEQAENREQRRFAASRRPCDGKEFAVLDIQMHAAERVRLHLIGVKNFRHAFQTNHRFCCRVHARSSAYAIQSLAKISYVPSACKSSLNYLNDYFNCTRS